MCKRRGHVEVADLGMKILGACAQTQLNSCRPRHPRKEGHIIVIFPGVPGEGTQSGGGFTSVLGSPVPWLKGTTEQALRAERQ